MALSMSRRSSFTVQGTIACDSLGWSPQEMYSQASPNSESSEALYSPAFQDSRHAFDRSFETATQWNPFAMDDLADDHHEQFVSSLGTGFSLLPLHETKAEERDPRSPFPHLGLSTLYDSQLAVEEETEMFQGGTFGSKASQSLNLRRTGCKPAWETTSDHLNPELNGQRKRAKVLSQNFRESSQTKSRYQPPRSKRRPSTSNHSSSGSDSDKVTGPRSYKGRLNHNLTEKRYRSRLNGQFDTLLSALPTSLVMDGEACCVGGETTDKRASKVSKAEVLILAKEHIAALERTRKELEEQNRDLSNDVEHLKGLWDSFAGKEA